MNRNITLAAALAAALPLGAEAALLEVTVTVENLAAANGVAFAPLHLGFHAGTFDAFNIGETADEAIALLAERGSASAWFPAFEAADPSATLGSVMSSAGGPLLPGAMGQATFVVDTALNPYFTFASMVVPSNDFFIGNDNPQAYQLFDAAGNLQITSIYQLARDVWDAGSEVFDPTAAAFVGTSSLRADQNSVVAFNFGELAAFDGLTTAAGYAFTSGLAADDAIYRISFATTPVPIPAALPMLIGGVGVLGAFRRRLAS